MRIIVVGADAWYLVEDRELSEYCQGKTKIINSYGMTEEAVDSTYFDRSMLKNPDDPKLSNKSLIGVPFPGNILFSGHNSLIPFL